MVNLIALYLLFSLKSNQKYDSSLIARIYSDNRETCIDAPADHHLGRADKRDIGKFSTTNSCMPPQAATTAPITYVGK